MMMSRVSFMVLSLVKAANKIIIFLLLFCGPVSSSEVIISGLNGEILTAPENGTDYSFYLVGHLYGAPENQFSSFPASSFLANISLFNNTDIEFVFSLGDNYRRADSTHISHFENSVLEKIQRPFFNSVGNHDVSNRVLYEKIFGQTYYSFQYANELYLCLDSEIREEGLFEDQKEFLADIIESAIQDNNIKNVFIFLHKLLWTMNKPAYKIVYDHINSQEGYPDAYRFFIEIEPLLLDLAQSKSVYWISGDIGCSWSLPLFFEKDSLFNINYVATGIGDTDRDAVIRVDVENSGDLITFIPVSLTGKKLQNIENYNVDYWTNSFMQYEMEDQVESTWWKNIFGKISVMLAHKYFWVGILTAYGLLGSLILIKKMISC